MHSYSTDSKFLETSRYVNFIISILICMLLKWIGVFDFECIKKFDLIIGAPTIFGIYEINFIILDKWLWKIFSKYKLTKIPNLNGIYKGVLSSSFNNHKESFEIQLEISQTLTKINLSLETTTSSSHSEVASIFVNKGNDVELQYLYLNDKIDISGTNNLKMHRGYSILNFNENFMSLKGLYFTDNNREGNRGFIDLTKCNV